jgi:membrane protease YdiL (CAAX protease family)
VRGPGDETELVCDEAPRVLVRLRRDYAFSEAGARELGKRVILLDGAGSFGPLLDNKNLLYNLDHHSGCERTFTLATCEQALLLVHGGLDLAEGDWSIYANEPDLDTVLALWILLNHARVPALRPAARDVLLPMVRLEGAIDSNGNELAQVCGLTGSAMDEARSRLDILLARERAARDSGDWQGLDLAGYTAEMLAAIDRLIYSADDFRDYGSVEEIYGHTEIGERCVAVVCRDASGIYAVEKLLKERWGSQLGVIALEKEPGHYTLRRPAALSDIDLNVAYDRLNLLDRNVDGRPASKRWGGSDNIGGSPRPDGSALSPLELLHVLGRAYRRPTPWQRFSRTARVGAMMAGLAVFAALAGFGADALPALGARFGEETARIATSGLFFLVASLLLSSANSRGRLWLHGWRRPAGVDWLPAAGLGLLAALPLQGWFPAPTALEAGPLALAAGVIALSAVALESCFRGLCHGMLQLDSRLQHLGGPWRVSRAAGVSALLYAALAAAVHAPIVGLDPAPLVPEVPFLAVLAASAFVGGLALAAVRERSRSLWPGVAAQLLGGLACAALAYLTW